MSLLCSSPGTIMSNIGNHSNALAELNSRLGEDVDLISRLEENSGRCLSNIISKHRSRQQCGVNIGKHRGNPTKVKEILNNLQKTRLRENPKLCRELLEELKELAFCREHHQREVVQLAREAGQLEQLKELEVKEEREGLREALEMSILETAQNFGEEYEELRQALEASVLEAAQRAEEEHEELRKALEASLSTVNLSAEQERTAELLERLELSMRQRIEEVKEAVKIALDSRARENSAIFEELDEWSDVEPFDAAQEFDHGVSNTRSLPTSRNLRSHTANGTLIRRANIPRTRVQRIAFSPHSRNKATSKSLRDVLKKKALEKFKFPPNSDMKAISLDPHPKAGFVYAYYRRPHHQYLKIGHTTKTVEDYVRQKEKHCKVPKGTFKLLYTSERVIHPRRVEQMVHEELISKRYKLESCCCRQTHIEWFRIDVELAKSTIERWCTWIGSQPYIGKAEGNRWVWNFSPSATAGLQSVLETIMESSGQTSIPRRPRKHMAKTKTATAHKEPSVTQPIPAMLTATPQRRSMPGGWSDTPPLTPLASLSPLLAGYDDSTLTAKNNQFSLPTPSLDTRLPQQSSTIARPGPVPLPTPPDSESTTHTLASSSHSREAPMTPTRPPRRQERTTLPATPPDSTNSKSSAVSLRFRSPLSFLPSVTLRGISTLLSPPPFSANALLGLRQDVPIVDESSDPL